MSRSSEYAHAVASLYQQQGEAYGRAAANKGQIWGNAIANIGQIIPQVIQAQMHQRAADRDEKAVRDLFANDHMPSPQQIIQVMGPERGLPVIKGMEALRSASPATDPTVTMKTLQQVAQGLNALPESVRAEAYPGIVQHLESMQVLPQGALKPEYDQAEWNFLMGTGEKPESMKAPESYTLSPGSKRFGADNQMVADNPYQMTPDQAADNARAQAAAPAASANMAADNARADAQLEISRAQLALSKQRAAQGQKAAGAQAADITSLTPAGLEMAALNYRKTGQMPPLGMGDRTTRQRIINRAAELTPDDIQRIEAGGVDLATNTADYKANAASLTPLTKQRDAISAFEATAKKNIDLFLAVAKKVPDTGIPLLNTPARWIAGSGGSADVAKYNAARQVAISEIAKIVQNPNLTGQLSDSARHEIEVFNPSNATLAQTVAVMNLLKQDMANRATSLDDQIKATRGRIGGVAPATVAPVAPASGGAPTYQDYLKSRGKK